VSAAASVVSTVATAMSRPKRSADLASSIRWGSGRFGNSGGVIGGGSQGEQEQAEGDGHDHHARGGEPA
jgi:hypothetical protein